MLIKWPLMLLTDGCDTGLLQAKSMMMLNHVIVHTEMELSNLDEELVKLLAWQRIQQLFPHKAPPVPQGSCVTASPPTTTVALKPQSPAPRTEGKPPEPDVWQFNLCHRDVIKCYSSTFCPHHRRTEGAGESNVLSTHGEGRRHQHVL